MDGWWMQSRARGRGWLVGWKSPVFQSKGLEEKPTHVRSKGGIMVDTGALNLDESQIGSGPQIDSGTVSNTFLCGNWSI